MMTSREKRNLWIACGAVFFWVTSLAVAGIVVFHAGMLTVQVHEAGGDNVSIRLPAALAIAALELVPDEVLGRKMERSCQWAPVLRSLTRDLAKCPDCVLVAVDSPHEFVRIAKKGRHLLVDVRDAGDRVHIAVPFAMISSVMARIERISRG
jgi:hypothetical protein